MRKRFLSVVLSILLACIFCAPVSAAEAAADEPAPVQNAGTAFSVTKEQAAGKDCTNVVLFAYFKDQEDTFFSEEKNAGELLDIYNGSHGRSFTSYMRTVSEGQFEVLNIFPQYDAETGTIHAVRLPYDTEMALKSNIDSGIIETAVNSLNLSDAYLDLDGNGDVDNLTIILQGGDGEKESSGVSFGCHKSDYPGELKIGSKRIATYNMLCTKRLVEDTLAGEGGLIAHEFLHSLGYPDLYEPSGGNYPVFTWDIMAGSSPYPAWPLAYLRMRFSGWTELKTIGESSHLTLNGPGEEGENQAYILKSPINEHELFVVEMRRKGITYTEGTYQLSRDTLDAKIGGAGMQANEAGLIVYRVDTTVEALSNYHGKTGIYVFRPQSGYESQSLAVQDAYLSPKSGRTSIGTADMSKGLKDGALTFADGTNSGIVIKNVADNGDKMTCDVVIPAKEDFDLWEDTSFASTVSAYDNRTAAVTISDGIPYLAAYQNKSFSLYKYNSTGWSALGSSWQDAPMNGSEIGLTALGGRLYLGYINSAGKLCLLTIDPTNGARSGPVTADGVYNGFTMADVGGVLYIAAAESRDADTDMRLLKLGSGTLEDQGVYFSGFCGQPQIAGAGGRVYVSCRRASGNVIQVYCYNGKGNFTCISDGTVSAPNYGLAALSDQLKIVATDAQKTILYSCSGSGWSRGSVSALPCFDPKLVTVQGNLYMLTSPTGDDGYTSVYQYDPSGDRWIPEGGIVDVPSQQITLTATEEYFYVSYIVSSDRTIRIRKKRIANAQPQPSETEQKTPEQPQKQPSATEQTPSEQPKPPETEKKPSPEQSKPSETEKTPSEQSQKQPSETEQKTPTQQTPSEQSQKQPSATGKKPQTSGTSQTPSKQASSKKKSSTLKTPVISSVSNTVSGIKVKWGKVKGAAKYRVFCKTGSGKWKKIADTKKTVYTWKQAKSGKKYRFTVRCITAGGKKYTSSYNKTGKAITYIAAPRISSVSKKSGGIRIKWKKSGGAAKYRVFCKTGSGKWKKLADTRKTVYTWKRAKSGKKYRFTVRCITANGKRYTSSCDSRGKAFTYKK